jgi:glycosyltransferase involved in cell wall biosynthesis
MKKVCIITCYKQPDYIRASTLRTALSKIDGVNLIIIKNTHTGVLRYLEVVVKTVIMRFTQQPDIYLLTFRGYELLIPIRIITLGKTLIFDEFINLVEWVVYEHKKLIPGKFSMKLLSVFYRFWLNKTDVILCDTDSHADLSSKLMSLPRSKFYSAVVSTDETTFLASNRSEPLPGEQLKVFYYGNMLPLHGIDIVIESAVLLKDSNISYEIIGGGSDTALKVSTAVQQGAKIDYKKWVDFDKLPEHMHAADICLGGPFGNTFQSQYVITGKTYQLLHMRRPTIIGKNLETAVFEDTINALVVEQGSSVALANAIRWANDHKSILPSIGDEGFELYKEKFSNEILSRQLKRLISGL